MRPRTMAAIALRPMGNLQGGFHFLSLRTGRVITARGWTNLPMPDDVVKHVNDMGKGGSTVEDLTFSRRDDTILQNPPKTKPSAPQTELVRIESDGEASDDDDSDFSQASLESGESMDDDLVSIGEKLIDDGDHQDPISTREEDDRTNDRKIPAVTELIATSECNALDDDGKLRDDAGNTVTVEIGDDTVTTNEVLEGGTGGTGGSSERNESGHEYNLRKLTNHSKPWRGGVTRQLDPKNFFVQAEILDYRAETTEAMFTQVSLKKGIKMFGDAGIRGIQA